MRPGGTEHVHHSGEHRLHPRSQIERLHREPHLIDADHCSSSRSHTAHCAAADTGQRTTSAVAPRRNSMWISSGFAPAGVSPTTTGTKRSATDVALDTLHPDQMLIFAFGREGLPDQAAASYVDAAMWYFLDGRHQLSRLELATAKELGAEIDALESAWKRGFFRSAVGK